MPCLILLLSAKPPLLCRMYEVARADGLVQATLTLKVEVNGMSGSDSVNLLVEGMLNIRVLYSV